MELKIIGYIFAALVLMIGFVNIFWGGDTGFGIFISLLSLIYFPFTNTILKQHAGFSIPRVVKVALGIFICWAALGVGELFDKIEMMVQDL